MVHIYEKLLHSFLPNGADTLPDPLMTVMLFMPYSSVPPRGGVAVPVGPEVVIQATCLIGELRSAVKWCMNSFCRYRLLAGVSTYFEEKHIA